MLSSELSGLIVSEAGIVVACVISEVVELYVVVKMESVVEYVSIVDDGVRAVDVDFAVVC